MKASFLQRVLVLLPLIAGGMLPADSQAQPAGLIGTDSVIRVQSWFTTGGDGSRGALSVSVQVQPGYHIYATSQPKPFIATRIDVEPSDVAVLAGPFVASQRAEVHVHPTLGVELDEHQGQVTWTAPVRLAPGAAPDELRLVGRVYLQACAEDRCLAPAAIRFEARYRPAAGSAPARAAPTGAPGSGVALEPPAAAEIAPEPPPVSPPAAEAFDLDHLEVSGSTAETPLVVVLPLAFLAGLLLNFMPCVLPVIGLKVMSFFEQAGEDRRRAFVLNLWYALGMVSVMMALATLAVFAGIGWGEQFSSAAFNVVLASVVFVFALSFLGVWEIPIPGFVGVAAAGGLAQREGGAGAFSKGVLTTVLATPCSGPLLGSALTWAVLQPAPLTYTVFAAVGLGMASPYLLIGAFPKLVAFLPKPGAWMATFKQAMGFVLLGTVVYLLSFLSIPYVVPAVTLMLGLGIACWWVGRVPLTRPRRVRLRAWATAAAIVAVTGLVAFGWLDGVMAGRFDRALGRELAQRRVGVPAEVDRRAASEGELPWQPFSRERLARLLAQRTTVFVDFTADWCLTCKANEKVALNRPEVRRLVDRLGIVTLRADKTEPNPEVDAMLSRLGNRAGSIPFYAVFSGRNPARPIVLDGLFTSPEPILRALTEAAAEKEPGKNPGTVPFGTSAGKLQKLVLRNQTQIKRPFEVR